MLLMVAIASVSFVAGMDIHAGGRMAGTRFRSRRQ